MGATGAFGMPAGERSSAAPPQTGALLAERAAGTPMSFTSLLSALSLLLQLDQGPALKVTVTPHFSHDPGSFLVTVHVRRDAGNQVLTLTADSLDYMRRGSMALDGADAPLKYVRIFDDLPAGSYVIRVELERQNRTPLVEEVPVRVLGRSGIR